MTTLTAKPRPPRAGEMSRSTRTTVVPKPLVALMALLGLALFVPALASAEFSRPYIGQITQAPTGPLGEEVPFTDLRGLAVDPLDNVYVGAITAESEAVDEFSSSSVFVEQILDVPIGSLAFDDESGKLVGATGGSVEHVAVDDTTSATGGDVYFARDGAHVEDKSLVERKKSNGEPADFTCREPGWEEYIEDNKLTGKPDESWKTEEVRDVAVDSGSGQYAGYIYVLNKAPGNATQVDRFTPAGCFVGAITHTAVPEWHNNQAFQTPGGVAVDPTTGDVLVEAFNVSEHWVIDEFSGSGEFLGQITGSSRADQFGRLGLATGGIAVSPEGHLYVDVREVTEKEETEAVEHGEQPVGKYVVNEFGPGAFYAGAVTGGVTDVRSGALTLNGVVSGVENTVTKEDIELSGCRFEYVSEAAFKLEGFAKAETKECVPDLEGQRLKEADYPVHAAIEGLQAGEVYRYRLVAETNPAERGIAKDGAAESFAAPARPVVEGASVEGVSSSWADFRATIDPRGEDTTYRFEYLSVAAFAANGGSFAGADVPASVPVPAGDVGSGDAGVSVGVRPAVFRRARPIVFVWLSPTRSALMKAIRGRKGCLRPRRLRSWACRTGVCMRC